MVLGMPDEEALEPTESQQGAKSEMSSLSRTFPIFPETAVLDRNTRL